MHSEGQQQAGSQRPLHFLIIDGSAGYRSVLSIFLRTEWPTAVVEEFDPFAQTLQGVGYIAGTKSDVILLGGIGTSAEACATLQSLTARAGCPPVILMVARDLEPLSPLLLTAGATSVLYKSGFSRRTLIDTIARLLHLPSANSTADGAFAVMPLADPNAQRFGQFSFILNGQPITLEIEHFRLITTLAGSPLAQVYSAERIADRQRAVVKVALSTPLHSAEARVFCDRFQFLFALNGRHVVRYIDAGVADSWPYVVLEYLSAGDLRRRMTAGITPHEAVQALFDLATALEAVHSCNYAHMDLKPENIFFRDTELVLIDFNISTRFGTIARNRITGDVLGSPFYMSPEQAQGLVIDGRSDMYSAGVIFYEMLTGNLPYVAESAIQVIFKHVHDEIPLLPKRVRALQPILDALMAKDRAERAASATELIDMLRPFLLADNCADENARYAIKPAANDDAATHTPTE